MLKFQKYSSYAILGLTTWCLLVGCGNETSALPEPDAETATPILQSDYEWTPDHMQIGIRWQPFPNRPENNAYDTTRPVITEDSSYVQFWISWPAAEPTPEHADYAGHLSGYLQAVEAAVDASLVEGLKVEFVFWHTPGWASVSGNSGGWKPRKGLYPEFVTRIATHFKGRVHSYQLYHEANGVYHFYDGSIEYLVSEIFIEGARAIRSVYEAAPAEPVIVSTAGCSPCEDCPPLTGLRFTGGKGVDEYYDRLIANRKMMKLVDALNLNVTDQNDGYGRMDGSYVPSTWGNYDLVRRKLDTRGFPGKSVMAAESWISWDDSVNATDVNGDGLKNEQDAYCKTITIMGQCLQRGLNTMNLPWSDNKSDWAMGLTKRRDYNGRVKQLQPDIVIPASDGGADIVTQKVALRGSDNDFTIVDGIGDIFTIEDYINPADPNHLHYYVWRWYAQIAGGSDEVIRHAVAGEVENDIAVTGPGYTGVERYRVSSFNRTRDCFTVLLYAAGANGESWAKLLIPSRIQNGRHYNNRSSRVDFRGEGLPDGARYDVRIVTKDIRPDDGQDDSRVEFEQSNLIVSNEILRVHIPALNKFTWVEFSKATTE